MTQNPSPQTGPSRRRFLSATGALTAGAALASTIAACAPRSGSGDSGQSAAGPAKDDGTITAALRARRRL